MRTLPHLLLLLLFMVHEKVKATDEWPLPDSGQNNVTFISKVASRNIGSITLKKSYMTNFRLMLFAPWFPSNWNTNQDGKSKQGNERSTDSSAEGKCTIPIQLSDQNCTSKTKWPDHSKWFLNWSATLSLSLTNSSSEVLTTAMRK